MLDMSKHEIWWRYKEMWRVGRFTGEPSERWTWVAVFVIHSAAFVFYTASMIIGASPVDAFNIFTLVVYALVCALFAWASWPTMLGRHSKIWDKGPWKSGETVYLSREHVELAEKADVLNDVDVHKIPIKLVNYNRKTGKWVGELEKDINFKIDGKPMVSDAVHLDWRWFERRYEKP